MTAPSTAADTGLNAGHDDRLVHRVRVHGRELVRKQYLVADASEVFGSMTELWRSSFGHPRTPAPGMPEPVRLSDDGTTIDMAALDGPMLGARGDTGRLPDLVDDVAALVADLHAAAVVVPRRRHAARLVASLERKFAGQAHPILAALAAAAPAREALVVSHGDCSPRNVVLTADGPALIDFDRLQMAGAGRDVQYMAAWSWVTDVTARRADRTAGWVLGDRFEQAYTARRPHVAVELDSSRSFHRASALVRIALSWSSLRQDQAARAMVLEEAARWASAR